MATMSALSRYRQQAMKHRMRCTSDERWPSGSSGSVWRWPTCPITSAKSFCWLKRVA